MSDLLQEVELKLELTPEGADALAASDLMPGAPAVVQQRSIYFDTPAEDLRAAGFSFRVRKSGEKRIQTVKATGASAAGLFARPEWEQPVGDDLPVLDDTTPVKAFLGVKAEDLRPVFEVVVERRIWMVSHEGAEIELALDRGEIVAGERRMLLCEVELELKSGPAAALFAFARRIDATVTPLRLGVLSKAERGYRLLGPVMRAVKAEPVGLTTDMTAAVAFQRIAVACLRQFRMNEALLPGGDSESVHQARVALRRLRSALTIFKPMLEGDAFDRLRDELRWLSAVLGAARDLDVLIARTEAGALRTGLEQARRQASEQALTALEAPSARALLLDLAQWLACGDWLTRPSSAELRDQPVRDFAASALDRFRRKVRKGGRDLADVDDEARHAVRKDAKKLRYAAEFFAPLFEGKRQKRRCKRFIAALETLQDRMGALNDIVSTPETLARIGLEEHAGAASLHAAAGDKASLIEAAAEAHDAFADAKRFWR